ncbi:MAG: type II toxin-antitoxin system HipA family toxin [Rhizomicrobium sp.]
MPRHRLSGRLNVFLNSRLVGELTRQASGAVDFRYASTWLNWEHAMAVSLSLPLREDRYIGAPVLAVFDNLLPDNVAIRRTVAERVEASGIDAFSLLSALGRDCVGALQFLADDVEPGPAGVITGRIVSNDEIAKIIDNLARNPLGVGRDNDFRISLAGAQEKTALLRHKGKWLLPTGTTPTTHIFKPQIGRLPGGIDLTQSVENEYLCLKFTQAMGCPSAAIEMATFGDQRVLVVERFDRMLTNDKRLLRVPQEDCCQALSVPWTQKYENDGGPGVVSILKLLSGSDDVSADRQLFLKAQIVFWLLGATDGHAKNFSLILFPGGGYRLSPLYDVVSAQPSVDAGQIRLNKMKMAMSFGAKRHYGVNTIMGRHFVQSAEMAGVGGALAIIDEVLAVGEAALHKTLSELPADFPAPIAESIADGVLARLSLLASERAG